MHGIKLNTDFFIWFCEQGQYDIESLKIFTLNTKTQVLIRGYGIVINGELKLYN